MIFKELKAKYKDIDESPDNENLIMLDSFFVKSDGAIVMDRGAWNEKGVYVSVFTYITKKATIEQMDSFIAMIKEN